MNHENHETIVILESKNQNTLGDISLFKSITAAERALEPIDVTNNEYFGYTSSGKKLALTVEGRTARICRTADQIDYSDTVRNLLQQCAEAVAKAKAAQGWDVAKFTVNELVSIIGFSRS